MPSWLSVLMLVAFGLAWLLAARWLWVTGDGPRPNSDDSACLTSARTWSRLQGGVAAFGLISATVAAAVHFRPASSNGRAATLGAGVSLVLLVGWIVIAFPLDPRDEVDVYGGDCGLA